MGFVTVPLHCIWVTCELASRCFEVAVHPSFPVKGIYFIMGNDFAGGKVMSDKDERFTMQGCAI